MTWQPLPSKTPIKKETSDVCQAAKSATKVVAKGATKAAAKAWVATQKMARLKKDQDILTEYCGTVRDMEISKVYGVIMQKLPFWKLIRMMAQEVRTDLRFQSAALVAFQETVEAYVVGFFKDTNLCVIQTKHVTILPKDVQLAFGIHGEW